MNPRAAAASTSPSGSRRGVSAAAVQDDQNRGVSERNPIADERVELASGTTMPLLGLGTWQAGGRRAVDAVRHALVLGYRLVDTATMYGNEREVGQALAESGVRREEVFVTTKLPPSARDESGRRSPRASTR